MISCRELSTNFHFQKGKYDNEVFNTTMLLSALHFSRRDSPKTKSENKTIGENGSFRSTRP